MMTGEEVRELVKEKRRSGRRWGFNAQQKQHVSDFVRAQTACGVGFAGIEKLTGLCAATIHRLLRQDSSQRSVIAAENHRAFLPVHISTRPKQVHHAMQGVGSAGVILHGPCGVRVSGLEREDIAEIIRTLST